MSRGRSWKGLRLDATSLCTPLRFIPRHVLPALLQLELLWSPQSGQQVLWNRLWRTDEKRFVLPQFKYFSARSRKRHKTKYLLNWIQSPLCYMGENRICPIAERFSQEKVFFHPQTFSSSLFGFWHICSKSILILIPCIPQGFWFFWPLDWELYFRDYTSWNA